MDGSGMDEAKGRTKEAIGAVTDDDGLKREGKVDKATGKIKEAVDEVRERVTDAVDGDRR